MHGIVLPGRLVGYSKGFKVRYTYNAAVDPNPNPNPYPDPDPNSYPNPNPNPSRSRSPNPNPNLIMNLIQYHNPHPIV